ncbi:MAG: class I SAM-dependent methyltransferase [Candidatus Caldarchaeum sp.]
MRLFALEPHRFRKYKAELVEEHTKDACRVLEVGCGLGHYKKHARGEDYVGIDLNPMLNPGVVASADNLPFRSSCFDVVIMLDVIEHVEDVDSALEEAVRVLSQRGKLLITTPNTLGFGIYDSYADKTHIHHFSWRGLEKILAKKHLKVERRVPLHLHIFWPLHHIRSKRLLHVQQSICVVASK